MWNNYLNLHKSQSFKHYFKNETDSLRVALAEIIHTILSTPQTTRKLRFQPSQRAHHIFLIASRSLFTLNAVSRIDR